LGSSWDLTSTTVTHAVGLPPRVRPAEQRALGAVMVAAVATAGSASGWCRGAPAPSLLGGDRSP